MISIPFTKFYEWTLQRCERDIRGLLQERGEISELDITNRLFDDYDWCSSGMTHQVLEKLKQSRDVAKRVRIEIPYIGNIPLSSFVPAGSKNTFYRLN